MRLIGEQVGSDFTITRRLSAKAAARWGWIWTVVVAVSLTVFWIAALPVREPVWTVIVLACTVAASSMLVAVSKVDETMVLGIAPVLLFLMAESTSSAEAIAVWGTAYMIGTLLRFRNVGESTESVAYLLGSALPALSVLHWLSGIGVPWPLDAVAFVLVYVAARFVISIVRLSVVTHLTLRQMLALTLVSRLLLATLVVLVSTVLVELLVTLVAEVHPTLDIYWSGAVLILLLGLAAFAASVYSESKTVSAHLSGTLAAANALPWDASKDISQQALKYARAALPRYEVTIEQSDTRNINEIVAPIADGYLVAKRGATQPPFLVQDRRVLDAIAHISTAMAATQQEHADLMLTATTDDLTNLPNYRRFREFLANTAAATTEGFAVAYVDIEHFKTVNDQHGHEVGNAVLRTLATRLRSRREENDLVARIGGDEFGIILTSVADEEDASQRVETLLNEVSAPILLGDLVIALSLSSGVAFTNPGQIDVADLVEAADARMYAGRGHRLPGSGDLLPEVRVGSDVTNLVELIRSEILDGRLKVVYTPLVDAVDDRIIGLEALVRPADAELAHLPTDIFMLEAQRLGLLTRLSLHVLDSAMRDLRRFQTVIPELENFSVNIDVAQASDPDFLAALERIRDAQGAVVTLEIDESTLNRSSDDPRAALERLRTTYGARVTFDDFGRYSSTLLSLLRYPVDALKLEAGQLEDLHTPQQQAVIRSMAALTHSLEIRMVAAGVEAQANCDELLEVGVRYMQGRYFGGSLSADEMLARFERHGLRARVSAAD